MCNPVWNLKKKKKRKKEEKKKKKRKKRKKKKKTVWTQKALWKKCLFVGEVLSLHATVKINIIFSPQKKHLTEASAIYKFISKGGIMIISPSALGL